MLNHETYFSLRAKTFSLEATSLSLKARNFSLFVTKCQFREPFWILDCRFTIYDLRFTIWLMQAKMGKTNEKLSNKVDYFDS